MPRLSRCRSPRPPEFSPPLAGNALTSDEVRPDRLRAALSRAVSPARYAAAVLLAAFAALLALPLQAQAQTAPINVPSDWELIPEGAVAGKPFRLLFLSSTKRNASSSISTYNSFIQGRAAVGTAGIREYSSHFRVVGCTAATDATGNTNTGSTDLDASIYWLNGAKVAG